MTNHSWGMDGHEITYITRAVPLTVIVIAHCVECDEPFTAVSGSMYNCCELIWRKHRKHVATMEPCYQCEAPVPPARVSERTCACCGHIFCAECLTHHHQQAN